MNPAARATGCQGEFQAACNISWQLLDQSLSHSSGNCFINIDVKKVDEKLEEQPRYVHVQRGGFLRNMYDFIDVRYFIEGVT